MSEYRDGDRVLVEADVKMIPYDPRPRFHPPFLVEVIGARRGQHVVPAFSVPMTHVHDHPGVPLLSVEKELDLLWDFVNRNRALQFRNDVDYSKFNLASDFRALRLEAQKGDGGPLEDGEECWVRARVKNARTRTVQFRATGCSGTPGCPTDGWGTYIEGVSPEDVRKEEP